MRLASIYRSEFFKFCCIGAANTLLHLGIVILLVELMGAGSTAANAVAFFLSNSLSYLLNSHFTFQVAASFQRYLRFLSSSLSVLFVNVSIAAVCEAIGVHYLFATALLIAISPIFSFLVVKYLAFGRP